MADSWQGDYASALRLSQNVADAIEQRNRAGQSSPQYSRVSSEAANGLKQYKAAVNALRNSHMRAIQSFRLPQREIDRRAGMLDELAMKEKQLEQSFNSDNPLGLSRPGYGGGASGSTGNPWVDEDDMANNMSVHDIRQHQQNLVKEQDEGLDILHQVILRQKNMAVDIGNEIDRQDGLIDDISHNVDTTDTRVRQETERVRTITLRENKGNCAMWTMIILLFLAIIVVAVVPTS